MDFENGQLLSARLVTPTCRNKSGGELIDGMGVNAYFGSVNLLDIGRR